MLKSTRVQSNRLESTCYIIDSVPRLSFSTTSVQSGPNNCRTETETEQDQGPRGPSLSGTGLDRDRNEFAQDRPRTEAQNSVGSVGPNSVRAETVGPKLDRTGTSLVLVGLLELSSDIFESAFLHRCRLSLCFA